MPSTRLLACLLLSSLPALPAQVAAPPGPSPAVGIPYRLEPFHADFPVPLTWPATRTGNEYTRTRRQIFERLANNLSGAGNRDAWQFATEYFWRAPEEAIEPLVTVMDRAYGNAAVGDAEVVRNCVEAMGRMGRPELEPALRRALLHKNPTVVQAGFAAMARCATPLILKDLARAFPEMDGRARSSWLRAARQRLGKEAVPLMAQILTESYPTALHELVLKEAMQMPAVDAAAVVRSRWEGADPILKTMLAGVLHAAGDAAGTTWLREALQSEDLELLQAAVRHCAFGELGPLREPLLRASTHARPEVRREVARTLVAVEGDDVTAVYETLALPEQVWEVRGVALRELTRRGRDRYVTVLLEELPTATGMRMQDLLNELSAAGDARAVPILVDRFDKAPEGEGRPFMQALSQNPSTAAAEALCKLFAGPERLIARANNGKLTTLTYLPTLLLNLRGNERTVLAMFLALPKADWQRRARLVPTLAGIAADRSDPELQAAMIEPLRKILFDRDELPQLRVLCLNELSRRWLSVDDAIRLRNQRPEEAPPMRALFADFLNEFF